MRGVYLQGRSKREFSYPLGADSRIADVSVSANGIATAGDESIYVWKSPQSRKKIISKLFGEKKALACALSPSGKMLVSAFTDGDTSDIFITDVSDGCDYHHCQTSLSDG